MIKHGFRTLQDVDTDLNRVQGNVMEALDNIVKGVPAAPAYASFVTVGIDGTLAGSHAVPLAPIKAADGTILRRAAVGMGVVAIVNLTGTTDAQTLFEQTISVVDQIQQRSPTNLAAQTFLVVLAK